jgi:hypothetical protein
VNAVGTAIAGVAENFAPPLAQQRALLDNGGEENV